MNRTRVLVVDDDEDMLDVVRSKLRHAGIAADVAASAEQALAMMRGSLYVTVVTDIHMPGISGVDLVTALKQISPLVQVVMLTSDATTSQVVACADRGAADFFSKTDSIDPVVQSVADALGRADRWARLMGRQGSLATTQAAAETGIAANTCPGG